MIPEAKPGPLTDLERFLFDVSGYLVIRNALSPEEVGTCLDAAKRIHAPYQRGEWRQIGVAYEREPAFEPLIDHSSALQKVRALLGDHFKRTSTCLNAETWSRSISSLRRGTSNPVAARPLCSRDPCTTKERSYACFALSQREPTDTVSRF